jgi:hypothetical protein
MHYSLGRETLHPSAEGLRVVTEERDIHSSGGWNPVVINHYNNN